MINAGDGTHEHPTQALLDALTLRQRLGNVEGRRVVIVGDILHSRVARSNVLLLATLGAEVVLVGPPTLLPVGVAGWPVTVSYDLDAELPAADAVLMLRVQAERMNGGFFPSAREYSVRYGLSERRQAMLPGHAVVLHPGPMLRGMEISSSVADFVAISGAATGFQRGSRPDGGAVPSASWWVLSRPPRKLGGKVIVDQCRAPCCFVGCGFTARATRSTSWSTTARSPTSAPASRSRTMPT